jgi:hypothetical protein
MRQRALSFLLGALTKALLAARCNEACQLKHKLSSSRPPPAPASTYSMPGQLTLLAYDNRVDEEGRWPSSHSAPMIQRSADAKNISIRFGTLKQRGKSLSNGFSQTERIQWHLETLPKMDGTVFLLDSTDTLLQCGEDELRRKASRLLQHENQVLLSGEFTIWPRGLEWYGNSLIAKYPTGGMLRFANTGALLGTPTAIAKVLTCMQERYGFPEKCPHSIDVNGTYHWLNSTTRWHRGFVGDHWGWEQACWHFYLTEQSRRRGWMASCPELVLDYKAEVILHLNKLATDLQFGVNGRIRVGATKQRSCILHAPGPSKYAVPSLAWWYDGRFRTFGSLGPNRQKVVDDFVERYLGKLNRQAASSALHYFNVTVLPQIMARASGHKCDSELCESGV